MLDGAWKVKVVEFHRWKGERGVWGWGGDGAAWLIALLLCASRKAMCTSSSAKMLPSPRTYTVELDAL
jgi:hypothetical protein